MLVDQEGKKIGLQKQTWRLEPNIPPLLLLACPIHACDNLIFARRLFLV